MINNFREKASHFFRYLASNNVVRKITKFLHINRIGKNVYFELFAPNDRKISHTIEKITAQFYVKNYTDLTYLTETVVGVGDERRVIKLLLDELKTGDVVYDIGAFLGLRAIFFAKKIGESGRVVAFEPSLSSYGALGDNIKLNNLNNIISLNIALGDEKKEAILKGDDSSMYSLSEDIENFAFSQKTMIVPGDVVVKEERLASPDVVKIDVEGYEYSVIRGLEKTLKDSRCRLVCCEIHPTLLPEKITSEMVIGLLKNYGFNRINTYGRGATFHAFCYKA